MCGEGSHNGQKMEIIEVNGTTAVRRNMESATRFCPNREAEYPVQQIGVPVHTRTDDRGEKAGNWCRPSREVSIGSRRKNLCSCGRHVNTGIFSERPITVRMS